MKQYADTPAAIALGLFFLGGVFYVAQLLLMTESWLAQNNVGPEAVPVAQVLGCAWLGYMVALLRTFVKGPTGSGPFFIALVVARERPLVGVAAHAAAAIGMAARVAAADHDPLDIVAGAGLGAAAGRLMRRRRRRRSGTRP